MSGHLEGGLWAEGAQDDKDTLYYLAFYTFWYYIYKRENFPQMS